MAVKVSASTRWPLCYCLANSRAELYLCFAAAVSSFVSLCVRRVSEGGREVGVGWSDKGLEGGLGGGGTSFSVGYIIFLL